MRKLLLAAATLATCAGCNMMAGLGKDLQTVGGVMTSTANDVASGTTSSAAPADTCVHDSSGKVPTAACPPK